MDLLSKNFPLIVYKNPINMHRSFNGLLSLAINELNISFKDETHVLFVNRDRDHFKILFFQYGHVSIFAMRLAGRLKADFTAIDKIESTLLHKLIETTISRKPRFSNILDG